MNNNVHSFRTDLLLARTSKESLPRSKFGEAPYPKRFRIVFPALECSHYYLFNTRRCYSTLSETVQAHWKVRFQRCVKTARNVPYARGIRRGATYTSRNRNFEAPGPVRVNAKSNFSSGSLTGECKMQLNKCCMLHSDLSFFLASLSGLFHRVILMSGSLFAPWARVRDPLEYALQLAKAFNCTAASDDGKSAAASRDHIEHCLR